MNRLDLGGLGLDRGGAILLKRALGRIPSGEALEVFGGQADLAIHIRAWCRSQGFPVRIDAAPANGGPVATITPDRPPAQRWTGARRAGGPDFQEPGSIHDSPPTTWGLAARGALVEEGVPHFHFPIGDRDVVWADEAASLYAQAAAAQWDPNTAIDWSAPFDIPGEVEDAVVQVMTFLIENETAALMIPARFLAQIHPHFREVLQVLAIQTADEARHVEVFTRRALLRRKQLGLSTTGGQSSLKTLMDEPDFAIASFLLSVLGEGSFLSLLWFLHRNAPDPVTRDVVRLAAQDEARHVAFGMAHLRRHLGIDPGLRERLRGSVIDRHEALRETSGLNEEVFDALVLIAAGTWEPDAIATGFDRVSGLMHEMDFARRSRLVKLGFPADEAAELSGLHTRNFM